MTNFLSDSFVPPPMPGILDGTDHHGGEVAALHEDATTTDLRNLLERVSHALDGSAEYGRALWHQLAAVTDYLREDLARGPAGAGIQGDAQWQRWEQVYGTSLATLASPRGDSGYGADQARMERRTRAQDHPGNPLSPTA